MRIGEILDNTYKIEDQIGLGGSGIIYKAYHMRLKKNVVIKLIKSEVRGKINERIEVDILKNLKHMYLPQVYDFISDEDGIYTVMDYIPGHSLLEELDRRKRFPQRKVIKWAVQLCEALSYLHNKEIPIIHSDIKPSNIMLTPDDNICLIDFNISLLFNDVSNVLGFSEGYSPPEQISVYNVVDRMKMPLITQENTKGFNSELCALNCGKVNRNNKVARSRIDARSDIYSLGATLYHLLTGERPSPDSEIFKTFSSYNINIDSHIKEIIKKAMQKDAEKRYQTIDDMSMALTNRNTLLKKKLLK